MQLTIAAIQIQATPFAVAANLNRARELVRAAVAHGATIVLLPELFHIGYTFSPRLYAFAEPVDGLAAAWLLDGARHYGCYLAGGILERACSDVYSTLLLATPAGQLAIYRKMRPAYWEHSYIRAGDQPCILNTPIGRIGLMMGADVAMQEPLASYAGQVDLLLLSSSAAAFPAGTLSYLDGRQVPLALANPAYQGLSARFYDDYGAGVGRLAQQLQVPIAHAMLCGVFRSRIPAEPAARSRSLLRFVRRQEDPVLFTNFLGRSSIYDAAGRLLAIQSAGEGSAVATVALGTIGESTATAVRAAK